MSAESQAASAVLMVRPAIFGSNPQTAPSNSFQAFAAMTPEIQRRALIEFDGVVAALEKTGVIAHVFPGLTDCEAPDEVFPNNWVSFHADGTAVLYPLLAPNRRLERRASIVAALERDHGYRVSRIVDLSAHETDDRFLEGTGSLVLDRVNRIAYACGSPRTDLDALADFSARLGYEPVVFAALDANRRPVYHTNVVMSVGSSFALVCLEAIRDRAQREKLAGRLAAAGRSVIEIDLGQMHDFAANLLELTGRDGPAIALSAQAHAALEDTQRRQLARCGALVVVDIPTIEAYGGGSVRCMLAEIHLPHSRRR